MKRILLAGSLLAATLAGTAGVAAAAEPPCGWLNARYGVVGYSDGFAPIYGVYCPAYQPGWRHFSGAR